MPYCLVAVIVPAGTPTCEIPELPGQEPRRSGVFVPVIVLGPAKLPETVHDAPGTDTVNEN